MSVMSRRERSVLISYSPRCHVSLKSSLPRPLNNAKAQCPSMLKDTEHTTDYVIERNRRLRVRGARFLLRALLVHPFTHLRDVTRCAFLRPLFVTLRGLFQIRQHTRRAKLLSELRQHRFHLFPNAEKLTARFEKENVVEQFVIEQGASLFPVTDHHAKESAVFSARSGNAHRVFDCLCVVVLLKPIAGLAQSGLATQFVNLKMKLCLFVGWFSHDFPFLTF